MNSSSSLLLFLSVLAFSSLAFSRELEQIASCINGCDCKHIRQEIHTDKAPPPLGDYVQALRINNMIYVSGSLGRIPETGAIISDDVEEQTEQNMKNLREILKAGGASFKNVVKTTFMLASIDDFQKVNDIYKKYISKPYPARASFQVGLPLGAKVEIDLVAVLD